MPLNNRTQIQLAVILDIIIQIKYSRIIARKEKSKVAIIASRITTLQKLIVNKSRSLLVDFVYRKQMSAKRHPGVHWYQVQV